MFLKVLFGLPPDRRRKVKPIPIRNKDGTWSDTGTLSEIEVYQRYTGRTDWPTEAFREAWLPIGRRGGKSLNLAVIGVALAAFNDYSQYLQPGERATVAILAADRSQSRIILRYVKALLHRVPLLKAMIERETAVGIDLSNQSTIEVTTASSRTSRGYTFAAVLCDEIAFWNTDETGNDPDSAILNAMEPGMATIPTSMLLCASSPYARKGELWRAYDKNYGDNDTDVLVWQAPTWAMNPTVPKDFIDRKYRKDPESAQAEFGAQFRTDIEAFVSIEVLAACTDEGVFERLPDRNHYYEAFTDPSGGSADSFTLCIGHQDGEMVIIDYIKEVKPPFSPEAVVFELCNDLRRYGCTRVSGDRFAGEWPREQFRKQGVSYDLSNYDRTGLYLNTLPALNSKKVRLLDHHKMRQQFLDLERRTSRSGKELIDHPRHAHDDVCNAVAGAVSIMMKPAFEPPVAMFGKYR